MLKFGKSDFFKGHVSSNGLLKINIDIWNNYNVHNLTGYSIEDLKNCIIEICVFMIEDLLPNRLEAFNINFLSEI